MMNALDNIEDQRALEILTLVVKGRGLLKGTPGISEKEAPAVLASAFGQPGPGAKPSEGELARQCLLLLSQDPDTAQAIATMAAHQDDAPQRFMVTEICVGTLALVVLSTRVRFEKDKSGKVSLLVEKKALDNAILKKFVELIQRFISAQ